MTAAPAAAIGRSPDRAPCARMWAVGAFGVHRERRRRRPRRTRSEAAPARNPTEDAGYRVPALRHIDARSPIARSLLLLPIGDGLVFRTTGASAVTAGTVGPVRRLRHRYLAAVVGIAAAAASCSAAPEAQLDELVLPGGFQPEGIAAGPGTTVFVGSIPTGAVFRADARTGDGAVLVAGRAGRAAIGLDEAGGRLYVAGGPTGQAFIYDAASGDDVAQLRLTDAEPAFVNDVVVTESAAFFSDSLNPAIYRVDRASLAVTVIPLTGDLAYEPGFNANGVEASADGSRLVIVQTNTGQLFRVEAATGVTRRIALTGGTSLPGGDGLLSSGQHLLVVQNSENQISVLRLDADWATADVVRRITDPRFDAPTTVARSGDRLFVVNASPGLADPAAAPYRAVAIARP